MRGKDTIEKIYTLILPLPRCLTPGLPILCSISKLAPNFVSWDFTLPHSSLFWQAHTHSSLTGKVRSRGNNGMSIQRGGSHCAEFRILFHKATIHTLRCWLFSIENRTTAILNIFPSHGIILSQEQSLAKPYTMTDCFCGRGFWMSFKKLFKSKPDNFIEIWSCRKAATSKTGSSKCHAGKEFVSTKTWICFFCIHPLDNDVWDYCSR